MYDTKSRELRWNATYSDYSAPLCEESYPYSESLLAPGRHLRLQALLVTGESGCWVSRAVLGLVCMAATRPRLCAKWHAPLWRGWPYLAWGRSPCPLEHALGCRRTRGVSLEHSCPAACSARSVCPWPEMSHFASSGDGLVVTLDKESGEVLWAHNYGSPVVGIYLWHQDSLRRVPHLNLAMETLRYLTFHSQDIHLIRGSYQTVKDFTATKTQLLYVAGGLRGGGCPAGEAPGRGGFILGQSTHGCHSLRVALGTPVGAGCDAWWCHAAQARGLMLSLRCRPALYVGKHAASFYALTSLVHDSVALVVSVLAAPGAPCAREALARGTTPPPRPPAAGHHAGQDRRPHHGRRDHEGVGRVRDHSQHRRQVPAGQHHLHAQPVAADRCGPVVGPRGCGSSPGTAMALPGVTALPLPRVCRGPDARRAHGCGARSVATLAARGSRGPAVAVFGNEAGVRAAQRGRPHAV